MLLFKLWFHICAYLKKSVFRIVYRKNCKIGKKVTWRKNFSIMIDAKGRVEIGDDCFFNNGCSLNALSLIQIGKGTIFGENVLIYDHNHKFKNKSENIKEQGFSKGKVVIENRCWIGSNVVILKNAVIGDNCVIGAGITVDCQIPSNTVVKQKTDRLVFEKIHE